MKSIESLFGGKSIQLLGLIHPSKMVTPTRCNEGAFSKGTFKYLRKEEAPVAQFSK